MNAPLDFSQHGIEPAHERDIDRALRLLGSVEAPEGLASRVSARLDAAELVPGRRPVRSFQLASAAAVLLVIAVLGMVFARPAWRTLAKKQPAPVGNPLAHVPAVPGAGGFSTAGARRIAPARTQTAHAGRRERILTPGRASIGRDAHRPAGVIAPAVSRPVH